MPEKKRKIENIVFWVAIAFLILYLVFRTEIVSEPKLCTKCETQEDCESVCVKYCVLRLTDQITSKGELKNNSIYCTCKCNTHIHKWVDSFL
jgi:hypothetical protein